MYRRAVWIGLLTLSAFAGIAGLRAPVVAQPPPATSPGATSRLQLAAVTDSFAHERDSLVKVVLQSIEGRESMPAESVFKNIEIMKGMPAGRVLRIMDVGFGRSLGVGCQHCHVPGKWAAEDRPQKKITRQMFAMSKTINDEILPKIPNLKSEKPTVNCTTCHRGQVKPAVSL